MGVVLEKDTSSARAPNTFAGEREGVFRVPCGTALQCSAKELDDDIGFALRKARKRTHEDCVKEGLL